MTQTIERAAEAPEAVIPDADKAQFAKELASAFFRFVGSLLYVANQDLEFAQWWKRKNQAEIMSASRGIMSPTALFQAASKQTLPTIEAPDFPRDSGRGSLLCDLVSNELTIMRAERIRARYNDMEQSYLYSDTINQDAFRRAFESWIGFNPDKAQAMKEQGITADDVYNTTK